MSITLDDALQTAQDGQSHKVIVDIAVVPIVADIPFTGTLLTESELNESDSNCITTAEGRVCAIFKHNSAYFTYAYTDINRQQFTLVSISLVDDLGGGVLESTIEASIVELLDGNIGMIYILETSTATYLKWAKLSALGEVLDFGLIDSALKTSYQIVCPFVILLANDSYLLSYYSSRTVTLVSSGTYTGTTTKNFIIEITTGGNLNEAYFKWQEETEAVWSGAIKCDASNPFLIADGVYIEFIAATYAVGMLFQIACIPATYAKAYISISDNPDPLGQAVIGGVTYTHQTSPLIGGGNPNDVAIDIYTYEITAQNLACAINDENYEGTGEGDRYGTGTVANPQVSASRSGFQITITALTAGAAGNAITVTVPTGYTTSTMSGGANSSVGACISTVASEIKKRSSADFETWAAETIVNISNMGAAEKENLSLIQISSGDIWLLFDNHDTLLYSNSYYSVSEDDGVTWSEATALTEYDSALASGKHPVAVQKTANSLHIAYHEELGALHMNETTTHWPGGLSSVANIHVYNGKVYAICSHTTYGTKVFIAVVEMDIDTWRITRSWTTTSTPAFHTYFLAQDVWWNALKHGGKYIVIGNTNIGPAVAVLDVSANTIKHFYFKDIAAYGIVRNVSWQQTKLWWGYPSFYIKFYAIDEVNDKLIVVLCYNTLWDAVIEILSIDLTQADAPGKLWSVDIVYQSPTDNINNDMFSQEEILALANGDFKLYPNHNRAILSAKSKVSYQTGRLVIYNTSSTEWSVVADARGGIATIPRHGFIRVVFDGLNIWGTFEYITTYGESGNIGVCKYEIATGYSTFYEPVIPVSVLDNDYGLYDLWITADNKLIIASQIYGIILYDIGTNEWTQYSNATVTGLTTGGYDYFDSVIFDDNTSMVFAGISNSAPHGEQELVGFSIYGYLRHPLYIIGVLTDVWSFGDPADFVTGYLETDCCITLDPNDNGIFAFWTNQTNAELSIKWDKETPSFNLMPYLVRSDPLVLKWSIDGSFNSVSFSLSHGHLFDPFNAASIFRNYIKKGYKIIIRIGERVANPLLCKTAIVTEGYGYSNLIITEGYNPDADTDYILHWQEQGAFIITERTMVTYKRGEYPIIQIRGEDKRHIWNEMEVIVGVDYTAGQSPEYILSYLLEDDVGELLADIDIPTFDNTTTLFVQFVEMTVIEIIEQIMNRYGYFAKITVSDDFTCRKISNTNDIDHIYSNADTIIEYTPDDTFSDYTNKIIVTCEGTEYFENIKYEDTVIKTVTGTLGWWGQEKNKTIWFDEEHKKMFKPISANNLNHSLRAIESAEGSMMFRLAGSVSENITIWSDTDTYCILEIEAPDLRLVLVSLLAAYATSLYSNSWAARTAQAVLFAAIIDILASVVTYNYEIHGYPVGYDKRSWQAIAEDEALIAEIGKEVVREIEEPLAYYIDEAQNVANHEMLVTKLQRKRLKITKIMHLQDEVGDTIRFTHPYSGRSMDMFVTDITRIVKLPENPDGSGFCEDKIEGWVL